MNIELRLHSLPSLDGVAENKLNYGNEIGRHKITNIANIFSRFYGNNDFLPIPTIEAQPHHAIN